LNKCSIRNREGGIIDNMHRHQSAQRIITNRIDTVIAKEYWIAVPLSLLAIAISLMGMAPEFPVQVTFTVICIFLFGFPHGAMDYAMYRKHHSAAGIARQAIWLACYAGLAAAISLVWWMFPTIVFPLLLLNAWQHFGREDGLAGLPLPARLVDVAVRGALVIMLPVVAHPQDMGMLYGIFLPGISEASLTAFFQPALPWLAVCIALLLITDCAIHTVKAPIKAAELALLALLFISCSPLIAFTVYFCFWHSSRHMLKRWKSISECSPHFRRWTIGSTMACTVLAVATLSLIAVFWDQLAITERWITVVFVGLLALTVPHSLLVPED
jgi:Brp/Blh family beta-carotene 15,15'-monooxygenase